MSDMDKIKDALDEFGYKIEDAEDAIKKLEKTMSDLDEAISRIENQCGSLESDMYDYYQEVKTDIDEVKEKVQWY